MKVVKKSYLFFLIKKNIFNITWQELQPDKKNNWLTVGIQPEFDEFLSVGSQAAKMAKNVEVNIIFKTYSLGISTNRDNIAYGFRKQDLEQSVKIFIDYYNSEVFRWVRNEKPSDIDSFVQHDD